MSEIRIDLSIPELLPSTLPVLALRKGTLLPGGVLPLTVGRPRSLAAVEAVQGGLILVVPQREAVERPSPADLLSMGVLARVVGKKSNKGRVQLLVHGLTRVRLTGFPATHPFIEAQFVTVAETWPETAEAEAMSQEFQAIAREAADLFGAAGPVKALLEAGVSTGLLVDAVAHIMKEADAWKKSLLQTTDPVVRAGQVLERLVRVRDVLAARKSIQERVQGEANQQHREYMLRQQLKAIQEELGQGDQGDELTRLKERLTEADLPQEVQEVVDRELRRLERINAQSPERSVAVDWLEWIAEMPWRQSSSVDVDLSALEQALDRSHFGLSEVKKQVVEHLAVRKLAGSGRADVLLLNGPPGVGKTSIAQAIADATGRKLVRLALGGVRDEAELRGHRRTYIGARPGRLVEGIRRAGTHDPVILLDEVDKLGQSQMGNPTAALLEILDPEQNHAFVDHYLEVPLDLSRALFIATANDLGRIPRPLYDRMEVLDIAGYSPDEKLKIARDHLLPKLAENAGLAVDRVSFTDEALSRAIDGWTREAGVRGLQRVLGKVYRTVAVQIAKGEAPDTIEVGADDLEAYLGRVKVRREGAETIVEPGIATGLAWTPVGGSTLMVEALRLPGNGHLHLTGQLGDVMKESARAALTYVLAHGEELGIPLDAMDGKDVHIHVPAGGTPKDGPSAGVTMFTALASLLSGRLVRSDVAMTGEASLRGRVLPVGGIKSKVLAAHQKGLRTIILPRGNELDLDDVPEAVRDEMTFVPVDHMREVLAVALVDEVASQEESSEPASMAS